MGYKLEEVYVEHDKLAAETVASRHANKKISRKTCWAGARPKWGGKGAAASIGESSGVPSAESLHGERVALRKLCCAEGAQFANYFEFAGMSTGSAQQNGGRLGQYMKTKGWSSVKLYTDLPPCKSCLSWLIGIGTQIDIRHYYCSVFHEYYSSTSEQQEAMWVKFREDHKDGVKYKKW
jgi:hypothetical protein